MFVALLLKLATNSLQQLTTYIEENSASVMMAPENHYGLESKQKLLETLQQEISVYEAKFVPLREQFALLEKYEKPVPDHVSLPEKFETKKKLVV